jgi:heterodisulfide reductase subunit C
MKKWGFKAENSGMVNLDGDNCLLYRKLLSEVPSLKACMFCGSCRATCTARDEGMNFMMMHLFLQRGETARISRLAGACLLCGKCTLVCPRNVDTRSAIYNLRLFLHESC